MPSNNDTDLSSNWTPTTDEDVLRDTYSSQRMEQLKRKLQGDEESNKQDCFWCQQDITTDEDVVRDTYSSKRRQELRDRLQ